MATQVETNREKRRRPYDGPLSRTRDAVTDSHTILLNRITWGAVFAGVTLSLVAQLILNMIGVGVGAATIDPVTGSTPSLFSFSLGAAIWWTVSGIIAAFIGGFTAGRLAGEPRESTAAWHGLTSWALATLVVFYLITTSFTAMIGGTVNTATNVAGAMGTTLGTAATTAGEAIAVDEEGLNTIVQDLQEMATTGASQEAIDSAIASIQAAVTGEGLNDPQAINQAAQALAEVRDIPVAEARADVINYIEQYQQAVGTVTDTALEVADTASDTIASTALLGALALLLGAIAAWFGGRAGAVKPDDTLTYEPRNRRQVDDEGVIH